MPEVRMRNMSRFDIRMRKVSRFDIRIAMHRAGDL